LTDRRGQPATRQRHLGGVEGRTVKPERRGRMRDCPSASTRRTISHLTWTKVASIEERMGDKRRVGHRRGMRIEGTRSVQHLALGVADSVDSSQGKPPNVPTRRSDYDRHTERNHACDAGNSGSLPQFGP
jgi:hypothetical protein